MGDAFRKVRPGEKLQIPAAAWNTLMDVAQSHVRSQRGTNSGDVSGPDRDLVWVRNDSGSDLDRFAVVGLDVPLILPTENADAFKERTAFSGLAPVDPTHVGQFAILLEPVGSGGTGRAMVAGVCPVQLNVTSASDYFADIADGVTGSLKTGQSGSAQILWMEAAGSPRWGVVRLGNYVTAGPIPVTVTKDGGVAGSPSANCTWTYTVKDQAGNTLATAKTPKVPRVANCQYNQPADNSPGLAYYDAAGTLQLYHAAEEIPTTDLVTFVTDVQIDGSLHYQKKTRQVRVLEADAESGWTTWATGTACT
jgi:hypothetical protein